MNFSSKDLLSIASTSLRIFDEGGHTEYTDRNENQVNVFPHRQYSIFRYHAILFSGDLISQKTPTTFIPLDHWDAPLLTRVNPFD